MPEFTVQAILTGDTSQLDEMYTVIAASENQSATLLRTQLAHRVIQPFSQAQLWDTPLELILNELWVQIRDAISRDDQFFTSSQHHLHELLSVLLTGRYWYPRESKPAQQFLEKYRGLVQAANECLADSSLEAADFKRVATSRLRETIQQFKDWLAGEEKRAAMLEQRLCESEIGTLRQISAETRVIDLLNKYLANRPLPIDAHALIQGTLKSELQYWAFTTPPDALSQLPLWKSWARLLPALGAVFATDDLPVDDQLLYQQIPLMVAELERSSAHPANDARSYQQLIEHLLSYLMAAVQKQPLENSLFPALAYSAGQSTNNTQMPQSVMRQVAQFQVGDWFIFFGESHSSLRCKLAFKNSEVDQLLLVDHTGRKTMIKSHKDFALCLSTGIAVPLPTIDLPALITQVVTELVERANIAAQKQLLLQKQKAEHVVRALIAQQQAAAEAAATARVEAEARMQAQLEARRAAARKAMLEARALAEEQRRRDAEQAAAAERQRIEQAATEAAELAARQQAAQQTVRDLQVGAWLEIIIGDKPVRAKLSVIIASANKYIVADQVGRKVAEYQREQLQDLLAREQVKVLRNGDNFEDQLAKVIRGLRRDLT